MKHISSEQFNLNKKCVEEINSLVKHIETEYTSLANEILSRHPERYYENSLKYFLRSKRDKELVANAIGIDDQTWKTILYFAKKISDTFHKKFNITMNCIIPETSIKLIFIDYSIIGDLPFLRLTAELKGTDDKPVYYWQPLDAEIIVKTCYHSDIFYKYVNETRMHLRDKDTNIAYNIKYVKPLLLPYL